MSSRSPRTETRTAPPIQAANRGVRRKPPETRKAMSVPRTIAGPPSSAVGLLCHRSSLGAATRRRRCASDRQTGVSARATAKAMATAMKGRDASDGNTVVLGDPVDDLRQRRASFEADQPRRFADVGDTARHVFEPRLVGLVVGDQHDLRGASEPLLDELGEVSNRDFLPRAEVEDLPIGTVRLNQSNEGRDDVADVAE